MDQKRTRMGDGADAAQASQARRQALGLLALGVACAALAPFIHGPRGIGLLALGGALLLAHLLHRRRLWSAAVMTLPFAVVFTLNAAGVISGAALYGAFLLAGALGVALVTLAARRGAVGANPWSPALLLGVIGALVLGVAFPALTRTGFYDAFVSLWMPALVCLALGGWYLTRGARL